MSYPKVELHVHLEGAIRPATLLAIARRNDVELPANTEEGIAELYRFRDFNHFVQVWILTTNVLRSADDFRAIVVDYAAEAASHGAVYLEAIFSPIERVARGVRWADLFEGYCDGAAQALDDHGVTVRLTPDLYRGADPDAAVETAKWSVRYRDRGIVGLGLGGLETACPADVYADAFAIARDGGLGSVPHAGESAGPESIRATITALSADRIRHGITAIDDELLVDELVANGIVLDVCPTSNIRTRVVQDMAEHPLPRLLAAGLQCTVGTDDPAMFGTDLGEEHRIARELGADPKQLYDAGVRGALCDETIRDQLAKIGATYDWAAL
ncbi:MAG: adenosine deaminase [Actinomycetes bacterium]